VLLRAYQPDRDAPAVKRIWREVGWIDSPENERAMDVFLQGTRSRVAVVRDAPECMVNATPATLRYLAEDIPQCCITGVTTSRIARKQGIASRLAADVLAREAEGGAEAATLGIFDQGFYNQLGFGNGPYVHWCTFDPSRLIDLPRARVPVRLGQDDWEPIHAGRMSRLRVHGGTTLLPAEATRAEMLWSTNGFGLGYRDADGRVTHHVWLSAKNVEDGPYRVAWMSYQTRDECLELFALLRALGDQVLSIRMQEPVGIQLQDLLIQPFRSRRLTEKSPHENRMRASAYWQIRILDLEGCLSRNSLPSCKTRFNLILTDPIEAYLPDDVAWRGLSGSYLVSLGRSCTIDERTDPALPTMKASINAFSRLWLGVRCATSLSWTDDLSGPPQLLAELDLALGVPSPYNDWDF